MSFWRGELLKVVAGLKDKLSLTGGTITGNLKIDIGAASNADVVLNNTVGAGALLLGSGGFTNIYFDDLHGFNIRKDTKAHIADGSFAAGVTLWSIDVSGNVAQIGKLTTATPAAGQEALIIPHGAAPTTPTNGSIWSTSGSGFFGRVNGATKTFAMLETAQTFTANQTFSGNVQSFGAASGLDVGIELGNTAGGLNKAAFIDFHSSATPVDYDVRLLVSSNTGIAGTGTLNISATGGIVVDGNLNINSSTKRFQLSGTDIPFHKAYESAQQTITAAGALTLAHGLGVKPKHYLAFLQCTTAELGYSVGDEVEINPSLHSDVTANKGLSMVPDATNINVRFGSGAGVFVIIRKDTGVGATITAANWRLVVRAWA